MPFPRVAHMERLIDEMPVRRRRSQREEMDGGAAGARRCSGGAARTRGGTVAASGGIEAAARRVTSVTRVAVEIIGPGGRKTSLVHFNDASVDFLT